MKAVGLFLLIHVIAIAAVRAQDLSTTVISLGGGSSMSSSSTSADDCKVVLPQMESDYRNLDQKSKFLFENSRNNQEGYASNFYQMTQLLFDVTAAREQETQMLAQSRNELRQSLQEFSAQKTAEASKNVQAHYMELTTKLYNALKDSQKILESLQVQLAQVESTRGQFETNRQELDSLENQKLALEARLVSLKIKCQPQKRSLY